MYYTKEHEWVRIDGNIATVGITAYAAESLGDITFIELPATGKAVKQFDALCAIESVKAASDIYAPVSGTVLSVNEELGSRPELVNESAEAAAWMVTLQFADVPETSKLMNREQYEKYVKEL